MQNISNENQKIIIISGIILVFYFVFGKKIIAAIKGDNIVDPTGGDTNIGKNTRPTDTSKATLTNTQAKQVAEKFFRYMDKFGTDTDDVVFLSQQYNGADLQKIYKAFGVRKYFGTGRGTIFGDYINIFGWFERELSGNKLDIVKAAWEKSNLAW